MKSGMKSWTGIRKELHSQRRKNFMQKPLSGIPEVSRAIGAGDNLWRSACCCPRPGCAQCSRLEMDVRMFYLKWNDRVVCVGSVPHKNKIKEWLTEATSVRRSNMMEIKILGTGCAKCHQVEKIVKEAVAKRVLPPHWACDDFKRIAEYGVFSTPSVVCGCEVKSVGKIPKRMRSKPG